MKIAHVIPSVNSESGGPVRSSLASVRAVNAVDPACEQVVATTDYRLSSTWMRTLRDRMGDAGEYRVFRKILAIDRGISVGLFRWLLKEASEFDLLVLRSALHPVITLAGFAARRTGVPYILTPHGCLSRYTFHHRRTLIKRLYFKVFDRHTVEEAAAVQCTCRQEAHELKELGVENDIHIIPHPYDGPVRKSGGSESGLRLLFLSRLDPMKGLDVLLPAFARILEQHPEAELVVAGSGEEEYEKSVRHQVGDLGLEDAVFFPGFVSGKEKEETYDSCDVFVLPSYRENYGIVVVEAMARGLPVIISPNVGISAHVEDAGAGLVVERSVDGFAAAAGRLLASEGERQHMGRRGVQLVEDQFGVEAVGESLHEFFRQYADRSTLPHSSRRGPARN